MGILLPIPFFRRILCYPPRLELVLCQAKKKTCSPIFILACSSSDFIHICTWSCQVMTPILSSVLRRYHISSKCVMSHPHSSVFPPYLIHICLWSAKSILCFMTISYFIHMCYVPSPF